MSPVTAAACLYLKCLAELSPRDMLLSERIIHAPRPPSRPPSRLDPPAGVKTGRAFVLRGAPPSRSLLDPLQACQGSLAPGCVACRADGPCHPGGLRGPLTRA